MTIFNSKLSQITGKYHWNIQWILLEIPIYRWNIIGIGISFEYQWIIGDRPSSNSPIYHMNMENNHHECSDHLPNGNHWLSMSMLFGRDMPRQLENQSKKLEGLYKRWRNKNTISYHPIILYIYTFNLTCHCTRKHHILSTFTVITLPAKLLRIGRSPLWGRRALLLTVQLGFSGDFFEPGLQLEQAIS